MRFSILAVVFLFTYDAATTSSVLQKRVNEPVPTYFYNCGPMVYLESVLQRAAINRMWIAPDGPKPYRGLLYDTSLQYKIVRITENVIQRIEGIPYRFDAFYMVVSEKQHPKGKMYHLIDVIAKMNNGQFLKCERVDLSMPEPQYTGPVEGYIHECGHEIFTYDTLRMSADEAISRIGINIKYPIPYHGSLYAPELGYMIYPVLSGNKVYQSLSIPKSTHYVVVTQTGEIVGMIAELTGGDYIKCSRKHKELDSVDDELRSGYICGTLFFESTYLEQNAHLAKKANSKPRRNHVFPRLYVYENSAEPLWIYPIFPHGRFWGRGSHHSKHFLLLDASFRTVDVVTLTLRGLQRCEKSLRSINSRIPDENDYKCFTTSNFFKFDDIMEAVEDGFQYLSAKHNRFPAIYVGPDFDVPGPYFTWPLLQGKSKFTKKPGKFRVVFNLESKLAGVLTLYGRTFFKCRRIGDKPIPSLEPTIPISEY